MSKKGNAKLKTVENTDTAEKAPKGEKGTRAVMITNEAGEQVKRLDYIRERWATKTVTRAQIKEEVSKLGGKEIAYQIVFAATKGIEGGPDKVEKAPKAETVEGAAE